MQRNPMLVMLEQADAIVATATRWEPGGMREVLDAYKLWPDVLRRLAEAWQIMHRQAGERYPLASEVVDLIEAVSRHQRLTASAAEEIAPTTYALHRREIDAFDDPRNAMWDVSANRVAAAQTANATSNGNRSETSNA